MREELNRGAWTLATCIDALTRYNLRNTQTLPLPAEVISVIKSNADTIGFAGYDSLNRLSFWHIAPLTCAYIALDDSLYSVDEIRANGWILPD